MKDAAQSAMLFQLTNPTKTRTTDVVSALHPGTTADSPTTWPHTWTQVRTSHSSGTIASAGTKDAVQSQDQVHSDFMRAREGYLQSEATTDDWAQKHTKQRYSRQKTEPAKKAVLDDNRTYGPNLYEIGSKEWMEEFDRRMGTKVLPLPDRPKAQEMRGEIYHEWHARYGCKTE